MNTAGEWREQLFGYTPYPTVLLLVRCPVIASTTVRLTALVELVLWSAVCGNVAYSFENGILILCFHLYFEF